MALNIDKVRELMIKHDLNQNDIACKGDIDKSTLSRILKSENRKVNIKTLNKIARALDVDPQIIIK